jgi:CheY-like chemotaxis protein
VSQPLVLAIEPDLRQAAIVKRIVREKALADVAVVDSRDAAIEAMRTCMPDVLLLSALLSPRDEDELIAHLKTLENAGHLQTHTIPQLASVLQPGEGRGGRGLLSAFRKKKDTGPANGCDPDLFADEIRVFLKRAAEKKLLLQDSNHAAPDMRPSPAHTTKVAAPDADGAGAQQASSSWSSPFEWKPSASWSRSAPSPEPQVAEVASPIASPEPLVAEVASPIASPEPRVADVASPIASLEPLVAEVASTIASPAPLIPQGPFPIAAEPLIPVSHAPVVEFTAPLAAVEAPMPEPVSVFVESAPPIPDPPAPIPEPLAASPEPRKRASGFRICDPRIREAGLVALGLAPPRAWLRHEADASETAEGIEDVRALLATLAVPAAIASVSYPRGCRIRRVRVPSIPESESVEAAAVIASGRGGAEQRDRRTSA